MCALRSDTTRGALLWFASEMCGKCIVIAKSTSIQGLRCFTRPHTATRPLKRGNMVERDTCHFSSVDRHVLCMLFDVHVCCILCGSVVILGGGGGACTYGVRWFL